jgi:GT2 family glycosyltransferase
MNKDSTKIKKDLVSVVIITLNRKDYLKKVLDDLKKQTYKNKEVIIIDNASSDGTADMVKKYYKEYRLYENKVNMKIAYPRNQGIALSNGEFVLYLDDDLELNNKDMIKNMVKMYNEDPKLGILGAELNIINGKLKLLIKKSALNGESLPILYEPEEVVMKECEGIINAMTMYRRETLIEMGGFNEEFGYTGEDHEMGIRIKKAGYKIISDYRIGAIHLVVPKSRQNNFFRSHSNRLKFIIINESILKIIFLPLIDLISIFNMKKLDYLKGNIPTSLKTDSKDIFIIKVIKVGFRYLFGLFFAYINTLYHLPKYIHLRMNRPNYIQKHLNISS